MTTSNKRGIDSEQFNSLFLPPPQNADQRTAQVTTYVELLGQFISQQFPDDLSELIQSRYPCNKNTLLDDVLATFFLQHPELGHAVIVPIVSCINNGLLKYNRTSPPFASFISLLFPKNKVYSEQLVVACGEILRILTDFNRPIYERRQDYLTKEDASDDQESASNRICSEKAVRPLSPWITDILLQAPLPITTDYFRWCGGVKGTYAASTASGGKHPVVMTSAPTWSVVNGAAVILGVCDEEVSRYKTCTLTAAAVPAVLLPPEKTSKYEQHLVAGVPALEPYARLFHRYYTSVSPSESETLLLRLLRAPLSWAHYSLEAAVQLVELLRAADDHYASASRLPRNWMYLYFLRGIGIAMSMQDGSAADAAAALLFRILSQPSLLFPPQPQLEGVEVESHHLPQEAEQLREVSTAEATAQGIASVLRGHGLEVEWRICMIWEAAYGLIPLCSSSADLPEIIVATSPQPPILSWSLYIPLLKVLEYLPRESRSHSCLTKIFVATIEAILRRTTKNLATSELRMLFHSLFLGSCAPVKLTSRLLFVALTICMSHESQLSDSRAEAGDVFKGANEKYRELEIKQWHIAAFDCYVIASVCALSFELHTYSLISKQKKELDAGAKCRVIAHTRRMLAILEALVSSNLLSIGTSNELVATVMVSAHVSDLFRRSKVCMRALSLLMKRKWDEEVRSRARSLYNVVDCHAKAVASIIDRAKALEARVPLGPSSCFHGKKRKAHADCFHFESGHGCEGLNIFEKAASSGVLRSVLAENQQVCFLVVSLLWQRLIASPEIEARAESSSAHQGWRKVVDALSTVVSASPSKAATAVVLQAGSELKPWIVEDDDDLGQKARVINRRIVEAVAALMNEHESAEWLIVMASSLDLLVRATDGILVDEEAYTLPQLELLEATARAVPPILERGESGLTVTRDISNLLKCRLPATACCVSHASPRVRGLSTSLLRAVVHIGSMKSKNGECSAPGITDLKEAVEKCLAWEAHSRLDAGLSILFVEATAKELGCTICT